MKLTMKKLVLGISGGISLLLFLILLLVSNHMAKSQDSQTMAERWSKEKNVAQVSCFFSANAGITEDRIKEFEHSIDSALTDAAVLQESENPGARLWADAYSADGRILISGGKASLEADAIGIGGDFFLFHPLKLLSGSYFSGSDLMKDCCIIDQDAAWQLFGSNNVAGMTVNIGGIPHIVAGVVERPSGRLEEAAGLEGTLVYVSYETLSKLGRSNGINHYEIVMPNPVSNFAENLVRERLGNSATETEVLENTSRYSLLSRLKLIPAFGTRSMNGRAIIYPYWENIARGYEDILAVMTFFQVLLLLYVVMLILFFFGSWWKHKGWTLRDKWLFVKDKAERGVEKLRARRLAAKAGRSSREKGRKKSRDRKKERKRSRGGKELILDDIAPENQEDPEAIWEAVQEAVQENVRETVREIEQEESREENNL